MIYALLYIAFGFFVAATFGTADKDPAKLPKTEWEAAKRAVFMGLCWFPVLILLQFFGEKTKEKNPVA